MARVLAIAALLVALGAAPARAGIGTGNAHEDILFVRDLPASTTLQLGYGMSKLGYYYHRFSIAELDLWRWDGQYVVYSGRGYYVLTDGDLELLDAPSPPLRYYIPGGLLVVIGLVELGVITATRRRAWVTIAIGGGLLALAAVFYALGLDLEALVPGLLGLHHVLGSWFALRELARREAAAEPPAEVLADKPRRRAVEPPHSPPVIDDDPFRAPPRATIAAVQVATNRSATAPVVHDPDADKPKLLG